MTHTPPIPHANQSPYPIAEPPHAHAEAELPATGPEGTAVSDRLSDLPLAAIGAAVGLGMAVIGGLLLGLRRAKPKPKRRGKGRGRA